MEKLKVVKSLIKEWIKGKGNFDKQLATARSELDCANETLEAYPTFLSLQSITIEKREKLRNLYDKEESDLKQRRSSGYSYRTPTLDYLV